MNVLLANHWGHITAGFQKENELSLLISTAMEMQTLYLIWDVTESWYEQYIITIVSLKDSQNCWWYSKDMHYLY